MTWGVEHTAMAGVFAVFWLWLAYKGNWSWLGAAALSQAPFWGGYAAFMLTGNPEPTEVNLFLNLAVAGIFIEWGHRLQIDGNGGIVHVWLAKIFLASCVIDLLQVVYPTPYYVLSQELMHYLALATIGGRAYVRGRDRGRGIGWRGGSNRKGGRLV